jgi:hypothetical protein
MICHNCGGENRHLTWCDEYHPKVVYLHTAPKARNTDPTTSHQAAASVTVDTITSTQARILDALQANGPMTDEELCQDIAATTASPVSVSGIRTRRSELVTAGRIIDTGRRQPTRTGRKAIVWGLK